MFKKGQGSMNIIVLVVAIVIGIAAGLTIFIDLGVTQQTITTVDLEELTQPGNTTFQQLDHPKIVEDSETVLNATGAGEAALVKDAEYEMKYRLGQIRIINGTLGNYNTSYEYKPTAYAESGTTRTILSLLPLFLAIGLIVLVGRSIIRGGEG